MKKSLIVCLGLLFLTSIGWSQKTTKTSKSKKASTEKIVWGDLEKAKGRISNILPVGGANFFTTRYSGRGGLFSSLYMTSHSNFMVTSQEKVSYEVGNGGEGSIEMITSLGKKVLVFLSDKKNGVNTMYVQKYGTHCTPEGGPVELAEYNIPKGWRKSGYFNVIQSLNQQFFCVVYSIPQSKEGNERFGYKVLNAELKEVTKGEYLSPYEAKESEIVRHYLSNTGDYFMAAKVFNINEKGRVKGLKKMVLMHVTENELEQMDLDLPDGNYISDLTFSSDNDRLLTFSGMYGNSGGIAGIFYFQLNFAKKEIINEGYNKFEKDFITQGWSERAKKKADKREKKGKGEPELYNYDVREMVTMADGSVIGLLEQFYIRVVTTTDSKGNTTTHYHYYYNDVIAYRVSPSGEFEWVKKIPKLQHSVDDGGYLSSLSSFVGKENLTIIFNDNLKNYSESGKFMEPKAGQSVHGASYRKKTNCVAKVTLDLQSGEMVRVPFFGRAEAEAVAVPKLFNVDYNNNEVLMLLRMGKKEKYGLITFG